jgi:hypothetical protein
MQYEFPTDHTAGWYVSRKVDVPSDDLRAVELPGMVVGSNGVVLELLRPMFVDDEYYRTFEGVLSYPGVLHGKIRVELDLNPYTSRFGEIGLRPAGRLPRLLVTAERFFDGAWSVLDTLAAEIAASGSEMTARGGKVA